MPASGFSFERQRWNYDCGYACAAIVAREPYEEFFFKAITIKPYSSNGTNLNDIRNILYKFDSETIIKNRKQPILEIGNRITKKRFCDKFTKNIRMSGKSLLIFVKYNRVKRKKCNVNGHWVLYDIENEKIFDPEEYNSLKISEYISRNFDRGTCFFFRQIN